MDNFKDSLTDQERKELRGFLNRRDFSGREHGRASAIFHLDKGKSVPQVAEITFLDEQAVRNFVKRYKDGGIDGLLKDEYNGRSFKLTPEQRRELARHLDDKRCILRTTHLRPMTRRIRLLPHIYLIEDNAGYYHARTVSEYLASGRVGCACGFCLPILRI